MSKSKHASNTGENAGPGGFLSGLGMLIEKLTDLAEQGKELHEFKEFGEGKKLQGVYGFSIKTNLGRDFEGGGVKVEPFGNVRTDEKTGEATVHEVSEPMVDIFEEPTHVLVVAEMPGVGAEDVQLGLQDDILTIAAEHGDRKYRKEVLLPGSFTADQMTHICRNGILEVKLTK
jgi:HSP20 family protein